MMTALQIEEHDGGLLRLLRRNRIRVEHRYCDSAQLRCVTYEHFRGRIGWAGIERFVREQRGSVLCAPELSLPAESGCRRFASHALSRRMCENAALYLLRSVDTQGVKVVLIDDSGDSVGLCEHLTACCDPLYAVSGATDIYAAQADHLLEEKGAALRVCRDRGCLRDTDLIIAPEALHEPLPCPPHALILTGEKPTAPQNALTIYDYYFDLPSKYHALCPPFLGEMYFAEALFTLSGARELGSELFTRCGDGETIHTRMSLTEAFRTRIDTAKLA